MATVPPNPKQLRILFIGGGGGIGLPNVQVTDFFTKLHFADYDIVLVDARGCIKGREYDYSVRSSGLNAYNFSNDEGETFIARFTDISTRIVSFVNDGGFCVIFLSELPTISYETYRTRNVIKLDTLMPYGADLDLVEAHGKSIEWLPDGTLAAFGSATAGCWQYSAYFSPPKNLLTLAHVTGYPAHGLASEIPTKAGGRALLLPTPMFASGDHSKRFFAALELLYAALTTSGPAPPLPEWVEQYTLPGERDAMKGIEETDRALKQMFATLKRQRADLAALRRFKTLFAGSDSALEKVVDDALTELGLVVSPGKKKRVDRIATWNDKLMAIEVQGVKKGAAEDHARSLAIWRQEVAIDNEGKEPKGLLVVNSFREELPGARTGNPWPGQTLDVCKRNDICAITGLQLLALLFHVRAHPAEREALVQSLIDTVGAYQGFADWSVVLTAT